VALFGGLGAFFAGVAFLFALALAGAPLAACAPTLALEFRFIGVHPKEMAEFLMPRIENDLQELLIT
jgi:hypothetical protein